MTRFSELKNISILEFTTSSTSGAFMTTKVLATDLASSNWKEYIYRVYTTADGDVNTHTCKAMCAFDSDNIGTRNLIKY